jgi:hypothetical protein
LSLLFRGLPQGYEPVELSFSIHALFINQAEQISIHPADRPELLREIRSLIAIERQFE